MKLNKLVESPKKMGTAQFIELFKELPEDVINSLKGDKGDKGEDGALVKEVEVIESKIDEEWIKSHVQEILDTQKLQKNGEVVEFGEITFDKFKDFFNKLPKKDLEKIRGPEGKKGVPLGGGRGAQGPVGPAGPAGSATVGLRDFQQTSGVSGMSETEVFSFTNSTGASIFLNEVAGESNARSEWKIYINDVLKEESRSSVSDHNLEQLMYGEEITNTSTVKVKVIHYESSTADYSTVLKYHA